MAKGKGNRQTYMYNRQTKAYAMNAQKDMMRRAGVKEPTKRLDSKKMARNLKIFGIAALVITVLATIFYSWTGLLICIGIIVLASLGYFIYLRKIDEEWIKYYKAMGVTKNEFLKMAAPKADPKVLKRYSKRWDKIKGESIIPKKGTKMVR